MNTLQRSLQQEVDLMETIARDLPVASLAVVQLNSSIGRLKELITRAAAAQGDTKFPPPFHGGGPVPSHDIAKDRMRAIINMMPIEMMELSDRTFEALKRNNVRFVRDLSMRTEESLLSLDPTTMYTHTHGIKMALSAIGLNMMGQPFVPYPAPFKHVPYGYGFNGTYAFPVNKESAPVERRRGLAHVATAATPGTLGVVGLPEEAKVADAPAPGVKTEPPVKVQSEIQLEEVKHSRSVNKILGQRFGKLVVVGEIGRTYKGDKVNWLAKCQCDCGNVCTHQPSFLVKGMYVDCRECTNVVTHTDVKKKERKYRYSTGTAESKTPEYQGWRNAVHRGTAARLKERGVKRPTNGRWLKSYEQFLADVGYQPTEGARIQRLNKDLGWVPSNVAWFDKKGVIRKGLTARRGEAVEGTKSRPATKAEAQPNLQNGMR